MATFNRIPSGTINLEHHIDGYRFKKSTGIRVDADKWDPKKHRATSNLVKYKGKCVNAELDICLARLNVAINEITTKGGNISTLYELWDEMMTGNRTIKVVGNLFMPYFKNYYETLKAEERSTALSYQTTYRRLGSFFGTKTPRFSDIDMKFYKEFGKWMEATGNLSVNSINGQWKNIKHIMRVSMEDNLHSSTTFEKFKRTQEESDNIALTKEEVKKIVNAILDEKLDKVRDWFLIQCYTGVAYVDICKVNYSNISGKVLTFRREKTDTKCNVPVHPKVSMILAKYDGELPQIISNQKYNKYLKEMAVAAKITGQFSSRITKGGKTVNSKRDRAQEVCSHTGRRTFATQLVLEGVPVYLIMNMTGHTKLDSFDSYIKLKDLQGKIAMSKLAFFMPDSERAGSVNITTKAAKMPIIIQRNSISSDNMHSL